MPVHDGRVAVPGVAIESHILPTTKLFPLAVQEARFDVTELSLSSHILQVARGEAPYVAIPAFVSRAFRHNGFYRRAGSGIGTPADFAGRAIGVPEYQMTAALWMRAIMADDYGVAPTAVHWRTGALDQGVRHERLALTPPPDLRITPIEDGQTLQGLLLAGEIDGLLAPNPPRAFMEGDPRIERVFPDFEPWNRTGTAGRASSRSCMSSPSGDRSPRTIPGSPGPCSMRSPPRATSRWTACAMSGSAPPIA
jgi:4,5-dihydroxyphthalate decarboxylase